ncbi:MAG: glycosyltransferase family 4 protein [Acidobacteria bacterium]|nr:glycosyltransferase family 4 protein [Acidobacteriota bacterium]
MVTNDFGPRAGGIETFIIGLLERIPKGLAIVYTSNQGDTKEYDEFWLREYGVKIVRDRMKVLLPTPRVNGTIKNILKAEKIERVWFGTAAPLAVMAPILRRAGARHIVAMTQGHEVWWAKVYPFKLIVQYIAKKVDSLTYLTDYTGTAIAKALGKKSKAKMVKILPGIDISHFVPSERDLGLASEIGIYDRPTIVSVGRLVHRKGQDRLIEALPIILEKVPDVALLLVGTGPHKTEIEALVTKHGMEKHVFFVGRILHENLPKYFALGDLFAMPARNRLAGMEVEGLGIVYLEASACGIPTLVGNSGGAPEALIEGKTGFLVDGDNVSEIAEAAIRILTNPVLKQEMGSHGNKWVNDHWNWQIWSERFNEILFK